MLALLVIIALAAANSATASTCNVYPQGYYSNNVYVSGVPPASTGGYQYTLKPDFLTCAEMESLNQYCVARINQYRAGQVAFSNGSIDAQLGSPAPVLEAVENAKCQAEITLGDFVAGNGGCGGAHSNAWSCQASGGWQAQNACCPRTTGSTYASVVSTLNGCLQQMWDEGMYPSGTTGHWLNMKGIRYKYTTCAFTFAKTSSGANVINMNQNFASSFTATTPTNLPTRTPTRVPTLVSTLVPTSGLTNLATTPSPTLVTTTRSPALVTPSPTLVPITRSPTSRSPTRVPTTASPSRKPTLAPTRVPTTLAPTKKPTTGRPTKKPTTGRPTKKPTLAPTKKPTTRMPTKKPTTKVPTKKPTLAPTKKPTTKMPTKKPTLAPTKKPTTKMPTKKPTKAPTKRPTKSVTL